MNDPAEVIHVVCENITSRDLPAAASEINQNYPFLPLNNAGRSYTPFQSLRVFCRDGFIDRYSGAKLVNPAVLRIISVLLPNEFPAHPNWKQSESHIGYWELFPTIDHLIPVARGGADSEENWVTTSMFRNSAKSNALMEEIGWTLNPRGSLEEWDGLTAWAIDYFDQHAEELRAQESYVKHGRYIERWIRASIRVTHLAKKD